MDDLIIIDDFIPKQLQDKLEILLHSQDFNWVYSDNTAHNELSFQNYLRNYSGTWDRIKDTGQMVSNIFHPQAPESLLQVKWLDMMTSLIWFMFDRVPDATISEFMRVKANLSLKKNEEWETNIATPHVDSKFPKSKSLLYYANNSDGDTIIYNERYEDTLAGVPLTIREKVTPKKGRVVLFDSNIVHSHMYNTIEDTRAIINFCFKEEVEQPCPVEEELREIEI